jgi:hypothetical protein
MHVDAISTNPYVGSILPESVLALVLSVQVVCIAAVVNYPAPSVSG